jgi:hypothetical protein
MKETQKQMKETGNNKLYDELVSFFESAALHCQDSLELRSWLDYRSSEILSLLKKENNRMIKDIPIGDVLSVLDTWAEIAHDEKSGFVERFCPKAWILTQVSWDSDNMRFVYILECGQHVSDSVKISEWLEFLSANFNK